MSRGYYFDLDAALRVADFASRFAVHTTGKWAGKPFDLLDWQFFGFVGPVYGWKRPDGARRFRKFGLGIPKKQGKSTLCGLLLAYHLVADGEASAECYLCASDVEQARIVYREASKFVKASRALSSGIKVEDYRSRLVSKLDRTSFAQVLSREAATKHGFNASFVLFDEFHTQRNWDLWNVLKYSGDARAQPLLGWISTAGNNVTLPWHTEWEYVRGIANGSIVDLDTYGKVYEVAESADYEDESLWPAAVPSLGVIVSLGDYRAQLAEAKAKGSVALRDFRQLKLNQIVRGGLDWVPRDKWDALRGEVRFPKNVAVDGGLDIAATRDFNALALVTRDGEKYLHKVFFWRPENGGAGKEEANRQLYDQWHKSGYVKLTPGDMVDWGVLHDDILAICKVHGVKKLAYDPYNAGTLVPKLQAAGIELSDFRQTRENYNAPVRELERLVFSGAIAHEGNPCMSWMIGNTVITANAAGYVMASRPTKDRGLKIDGVPATLMALALHMQRAETARRSYSL